jgi:hypothetical protein
MYKPNDFSSDVSAPGFEHRPAGLAVLRSGNVYAGFITFHQDGESCKPLHWAKAETSPVKYGEMTSCQFETHPTKLY